MAASPDEGRGEQGNLKMIAVTHRRVNFRQVESGMSIHSHRHRLGVAMRRWLVVKPADARVTGI
jgi:hypothetical protein